MRSLGLLTKLELTVREIRRSVKFGEKVAVFPGKYLLLVLLTNELLEQMDLSLANVSARGLDKNCFFHETSIHGSPLPCAQARPMSMNGRCHRPHQALQSVTVALIGQKEYLVGFSAVTVKH